MQAIQEIIPDASMSDIQNALSSANGNVAEAVENLLPGELCQFVKYSCGNLKNVAYQIENSSFFKFSTSL